MNNKGLYFACDELHAWGFSFAVVYDAEHRDFQIAIMFLNIMVAIGYTF